MRERFAIPPFDRAAALIAPSKEARRARLKQYRQETVEPLVFASAERELEDERNKAQHAGYLALHPGRGPVASALSRHGWGPDTLPDYRRWAALRLLMRVRGLCPECGALDGTAEHILAHVQLRMQQAGVPAPAVALDLLKTTAPADELRRNVRAVGQTLQGRRNWRWLEARAGAAPAGVGNLTPPCSPRDEEEAV